MQSCPVSDSAVPNLEYSRFGAAKSDTGNDCMDIRPHYNSIPTVNWYRKVVVMSHVPSHASVSDSVPPNLLYCRFGTAESDTEALYACSDVECQIQQRQI